MMNTPFILAGLLSVCSAFSFTLPSAHQSSHGAAINPVGRFPTSLSSSISSNENLLPGIAAIDGANEELTGQLESLRQVPYFRLYSVDILASCEYIPQELFECYSETCEVYPIDDEEVPEKMREVDFNDHNFELDGWARWDMPSNDYYDIEEFQEGYTGYDGSEIWNFIHDRICFDGYTYDDNNWKADFNKAVSGIHAVVAAQVVRGIRDRVDEGGEFTDDEIWRDPQKEFNRRLSPNGENPRSLENLYFTYMLFLSAAAKVKDRLLADCESGDIDSEAASVLQSLLSSPIFSDPSVEVAQQTIRSNAAQSVDNLWEVRMRTRELLRIMNCVQCNKCRLHGKIAMMGMSTALQIHLGKTGEGTDSSRIHRVELAALMSTLYKISRAVQFCKQMM